MDNLSTRLFYREEWLDNRKSIYCVTERKPSGGWPNPRVSLHLSRISFRILVHDQSQVLQTTGGARRGLLFLLFISMRARTMAARYFYQE